MNRLFKILLITIGIIIAMIVVGFVLIKSYLTPETARSIAENIATEAIKRPVDIGKVGVAIGFKVGITVDDVTIANTKGFSSEPLMHIDKTTLVLKIIPLIRRQIVISSIDFVGMQLNIERDKKGTFNFASLAPKEGKGTGWTISLSSLSFSDGEVIFTDSKEHMEIRLKELNQRIVFNTHTIAQSGSNTLYILKHEKLPEMVIKLKTDIEYDTLKKDLQIKKLSALYDPIFLELSGSIEHMENLNLTTRVRIDDMSGLKPLIPNDSRPAELSGAMHADVTVLGNTKEPVLDGRCEFKKVKIIPKNMTRGIEDLSGTLSFDRDAIRNIVLEGKLGSAQLIVRGSVEQLKNPLLDISAKVNGDLRDLEALSNDVKDIKMKGPFEVDCMLKGTVKKPSLHGDYAIHNATVDGIGFAQPVSQLEMKGMFQDDVIKLNSCTCKIGRSDFNMHGTISNFKEPVVELHSTSSSIDLDEMLPKPDKGAKTKQEGAPVKVTGTVQATTLNGIDIALRNVNTSYTYDKGIIDIKDCKADAFDGKVRFDFYYNAHSPEPYRINTNMQSVSTKKVLRRFLKFENIEGSLSGMSNFSGKGLSRSEVLANMSASGNLKLNNGAFNNFTFVTSMLAWLGMKGENTVPIENLVLYFKIDKGKVQVNDWALSSSIGNMLFNGTMGLDGGIDLNIAATLNKKYSDVVKKYHGDWIFPIDKNGKATIDILAKGTLKSPKFSLDKTKIKNRIKGKVKDEFDKKKKEWENKIKGLLKG
jgi:uncharacterized protein involved in outer membrane biogenesis